MAVMREFTAGEPWDARARGPLPERPPKKGDDEQHPDGRATRDAAANARK